MISLPKNKKILFFASHPDDDVISSGALLYQLTKNGNQIISIFITLSPKGVNRNISFEEKIALRKNETKQACQIIVAKPIFLDLDKPVFEINQENKEIIINLLKNERPDIIFLPPEYDAHSTHQKVNKLITQTIKQISLEEIWYYETWTPLLKPNFIFFFDDELMEIKKTAIAKHKSQIERLDFIKAAVGLNSFRAAIGQELLGDFGSKYYNNQKYGEAFFIEKYE
ncbi:MAG: hypothetical protein ACD_12C00436G0002 [uncultured bacterium]|nr:MAG: hypothetical protein ACD_12C00436G0002 [uncultured bacterium]